MLHGGFGVLDGREAVRVVWHDHAVSREALGVETTRAWLRGKLDRPDVFDTKSIAARLAALETTGRPTYFDRVLDVFAEHDRITLLLA